MGEQKTTSICLRISKCLETTILKLKQTKSRFQTAVILFICFVSVFGQVGTVYGESILDRPTTAETEILNISGIVATPDDQRGNYEIKPNNVIFREKWGTPGDGDGQFYFPLGIAVDSTGNAYVADQGNHRIQKFDSNGNFLVTWGSYGSGDGQFILPSHVAVDNTGNVYVVAGDYGYVQKFDSNGNFLAKWARPAHGIAVDSFDNVYVGDSTHGRIHEFDTNGNLIKKWSTWVPIEHCYISCVLISCQTICTDSWDSSPIAVAVDKAGNVYVVHEPAAGFREVASQIFKYDSDGHFLARWGPPISEVDQFPPRYASDLAVDSLNNIYVTFNVIRVETVANNLIEKFDGNGNLIKQWGSWGTGNGQFENPEGIAVHSSGNIYVADTGNNRIQKFEQTFQIRGTVRTAAGAVISGVSMTLSGDASKSVTTDSSGMYRFKNIPNGSYTVTPEKAGYDFTPASTNVGVYGRDVAKQNFTGATFAISGSVKKANGTSIAGVLMTLTGDASKTVTTDSNGVYRFKHIANGNYTITPSKTGFTFTPADITLDINGASVKGQNFTGAKIKAF